VTPISNPYTRELAKPFYVQERNLVKTEPSLWPVQLYGTVYQQQFVKQTDCIRKAQAQNSSVYFML